MRSILKQVGVGLALAAGSVASSSAHAEMLAMLVYETKAEESLKALRTQSETKPTGRREGIAIIDVDPASPRFGSLLLDIALPTGFLGHHIYYNNDLTKAYVTGFGHSALRVIDLTRVPWRMRTVAIPDCRALDHVIFSGDNARWWLTCVGSQSVIVGDGQTDEPVKVIHLPKPYPHGIALHEGIDRLLVANVHNPYTYLDSQQTVTVIEASTGTPLSTVRLAHGPGAEVQSPADVLFVPGADPPAAYVTNVDSNSLWLMTWDPGKADFDATQVFDFASIDSRLPILLYYNRAGDRLYVITMGPGRFHIFDIADDLRHPKLLKTVDCAEGAHHAAFSPDERYAFVQNGLLNVPGLSDGSITVIDLERQEAVASIDTFKELGLAHKHIIMLPDWYTPMGW